MRSPYRYCKSQIQIYFAVTSPSRPQPLLSTPAGWPSCLPHPPRPPAPLPAQARSRVSAARGAASVVRGNLGAHRVEALGQGLPALGIPLVNPGFGSSLKSVRWFQYIGGYPCLEQKKGKPVWQQIGAPTLHDCHQALSYGYYDNV